ncbi:MAG: hypothetical protein KC506_01440 [Nanoarchaeota archaeon]|nr:hypothetical protein [Nanoarchaeota archaeon]
MTKSNNLLMVLYLALAFFIGFFASSVFDFYSTGITGRSIDVPSDHFSSKDILVFDDYVKIKVEGARITNYDDTGSMLPTLGYGVNGISVKPESEEEISVGDIVSYWKDEKLIVHRVIEKGFDSEGVYFVTKGDNAATSDGKIRFSDIEHVLVGLVY